MNAKAEGRHRGGLLLLAAGLAQYIVCADYFAVAIALPPMAEEFEVRAIDLQWVITGYVLSFCALLAVAGPLGDRYGRKKLLLLGIVLFALVSIWVGLSDSVGMVITARIALGIGGGLLFPLATAVVSHASIKANLARNIALLTGVATLGSATGPVLGGVFTELLDWRWIFFANVPVCGVAFLMISLFAKESRDPDAGGRFDFAGIALLITGIAAFSVGIDRIPHWPLYGWLSLLGGGIVVLVVFLVLELRIRAPLIDLRLFRNREFAGYSISGLLANSAWCMLVFASTLLLQKVLMFSVLEAGLFFLFMSGSIALASFTAPIFERRVGTAVILRLALVFQVMGLGLLFVVDSPVWLAIGMAVAGVGCSWGWSMPQAGAIRTLPREKSGLASGSILTLMILSGNTAIVVIAMIIDLFPDDPVGEAEGIRISFLIAAITAAVGLLVACTILRRLGPIADDPQG